MNTPEENKKNLFEIKKIVTEIILTIALAWIACWFITDSAFYSVAMVGSVIFVKLLRVFKMSLKLLYVLSAIALSVAILVTVFI